MRRRGDDVIVTKDSRPTGSSNSSTYSSNLAACVGQRQTRHCAVREMHEALGESEGGSPRSSSKVRAMASSSSEWTASACDALAAIALPSAAGACCCPAAAAEGGSGPRRHGHGHSHIGDIVASTRKKRHKLLASPCNFLRSLTLEAASLLLMRPLERRRRAARRNEPASELHRSVRSAAEHTSLDKAAKALANATPQQLAEANSEPFSIFTPALRAAGANAGKAPREPPLLLKYVRAALAHGFDPDAASIESSAAASSPPLVTSAAYGFAGSCAELLRAGASADSVNLDGDTAAHAAIEHPQVMGLLLRAEPRLVHVENKWGLSPFVRALIANPLKPVHRQSALLMAPHTMLSDMDLLIVRRRRRGHLLEDLAQLSAQRAGWGLLPTSARFWHEAWHWSFPTTDRDVLELLLSASHRGEIDLDRELVVHIFGFIERGWFRSPRGRARQ